MVQLQIFYYCKIIQAVFTQLDPISSWSEVISKYYEESIQTSLLSIQLDKYEKKHFFNFLIFLLVSHLRLSQRILGDANLCSIKWNDESFLYEKVANALKNVLQRCEIVCMEVGVTYQADHMQKNGHIAESAIDHIYSSKSLESRVEIKKLQNGSSDHVPVVATVKNGLKNIYINHSWNFKNFV